MFVKIVINYICPPIPINTYDYSAHLDGYEPGEPCGWGASVMAAIQDLIKQIEGHTGQSIEQQIK
jgi:hypothetical protein